MAKKNTYNYDAFISYRHSELDSFVAENIHHELEKFKLPNNIAKLRGEGQKTKIERVFRDRDELPIASDLSANITEALENSEFLIVICTPRLKESMWCKSEIDSFIALRGRERVLAVLAEGEPVDSFPEQITKAQKQVVKENGETVTEWVDVEPLAADVRGDSRSVIKKKIKEEVMRLAAAMFDCNYDEIKQRHREQILKRRIKIAAGITVASLIFGGVSAYQAFTIDKQGKKINEQYSQIQDQYTEITNQYDEIERQYKDNLVKQSEIAMSQAQTYLNEGNVDAAKKLLVDTYTSAGEKLPDDAKSNLQYMLAEVLRIYDDGTKLNPIANFSMESTVKLINASPDYKYFMAFDINNNLAIWNMETMAKVYEAKTDFSKSMELEQNYYFDSKGHFYYVGDNTVCRINCESGKADWSTEIKMAKRAVDIDKDNFFIMASDTAYILNKENGSIVKSNPIKEIEGFVGVDKIMLSSDGKSMFVYSTSSKDNKLLKISVDSLEVTASKSFGDMSLVEGISDGKGHIIWESLVWGSNPAADGYECLFHCVDEKTLEEKWTKPAEHMLTRMVLYKGEIVSYYSGGMTIYDPADCSVKRTCQIDRNISDILVMADGRFKLLLTDGSYKIQNTAEFSFFENGAYAIPLDQLKSYKYIGYYLAALPHRSNLITIYTMKPSSIASEAGKTSSTNVATRDTICKLKKSDEPKEGTRASVQADGIVIYEGSSEVKKYDVNTNYINGAYYAAEAKLLIIAYGDYRVEIRSSEDYTLKNVLNFEKDCEISAMDDKHIIVSDFNDSYVINLENAKIEAKLYGFVSYDKTSNSFTLCNDVYDGTLYKVPFKSLEELIEMTK